MSNITAEEHLLRLTRRVARQKRAELKSVLDPQTKKNLGMRSYSVCSGLVNPYIFIEILIQRVKKLSPEEVAMKIKEFDPEVCTQVFLSGLKNVVPTPEQVRSSSTCRSFTEGSPRLASLTSTEMLSQRNWPAYTLRIVLWSS